MAARHSNARFTDRLEADHAWIRRRTVAVLRYLGEGFVQNFLLQVNIIRHAEECHRSFMIFSVWMNEDIIPERREKL